MNRPHLAIKLSVSPITFETLKELFIRMVENVKQVIQNASKARETKAESFWGFFCKSCGGTLKQKSVSLSNK